jgi:hypothetical protein
MVGIAPRAQSSKHNHQSLNTPNFLSSVCKSLLNIDIEDQVSKAALRSFPTASQFQHGSTVLVIPMDVAKGVTTVPAFDCKKLSSRQNTDLHLELLLPPRINLSKSQTHPFYSSVCEPWARTLNPQPEDSFIVTQFL